jgi:hypothetical protein
MENKRFVSKKFSELEGDNCSPISGFEVLPLLTLEETVETITPLISDVMKYVTTAKKKYNRCSPLLTRDEAAAIYLYSMPTSFFSYLNVALRNGKRDELKPWFAFLRLLITALDKLPRMKQCTLWRGVTDDGALGFDDDKVHTWWSVNSCSTVLKVVEPFLGKKGTLFAIEATQAKNISEFAVIPDEQEVILMPGTRVRCKCSPLSIDDRYFVVHLEEIIHER